MSIHRAVNFACLWVWITARHLLARPAHATSGQSSAEFALICFFIAIVSVPAISFLRESITALHLVHQTSLGGPVQAPVASPAP